MKMTIDEVIAHYEKNAEELINKANQKLCHCMIEEANDYNERAGEYEQLVEWLKELKRLRKAYDKACEHLIDVTPCAVFACADCPYFINDHCNLRNTNNYNGAEWWKEALLKEANKK